MTIKKNYKKVLARISIYAYRNHIEKNYTYKN
jgi:hypothetical protein